jgi:hypothetical protein
MAVDLGSAGAGAVSRPGAACDRRAVLRLAAGAMLLPLASAAGAHPSSPGTAFAPPDGPMLYTRRLERVFPDGARFTVARSFEVRFEHWGDGFRVEGRQVGVEVEAPEALAAFAKLEREREREERGLFPLLLEADGSISEGAGAPLATRLDDAVRESLALIEARAHEAAEHAELVRFVQAFHQSAGRLVTELPPDLFAPPPDPRVESRAVALPGGDSGEVTVTFAAARDPATGLMREALREVVTALEGDRRRTLETWQLAPL